MMSVLFLYLLKVNFLLLVFTATYWLLLRRGGLLQLNRLILVASILLAFLLPVLPMSDVLEQSIPAPVLELAGRPAAALPEFAPLTINETTVISEPSATTVSTAPPPPFPISHLRSFAFWIFIGVASFLFFLLVRQFVHIFKLILYSTNTRENGLTIVHTDEDIPPFSFFRFLVINPAKYAGEELQRIIVHEKVHIRQYHYIDILAGEFLRVLCWYNPAAWALNALLKMNLEYIADEQVLSAGIDRKDYQYQLLHMQSGGQSLRLTTPLNYSPLKMRISMMNTKKSGALAQLRYALLLPVFLLAAMMVNPAPTLAQEAPETKATSTTIAVDTINIPRGTAKVVNSDATPGSFTASKGLAKASEGATVTPGSVTISQGLARASEGATVTPGSVTISQGLARASEGGTATPGSLAVSQGLAKTSQSNAISGSATVSQGLAKTYVNSATPGSITVKEGLATVSEKENTVSSASTAGRDVYFVIRPTTKRKTLMDVQETLAGMGIIVKYNNLNYNDGLLTAISVSIRTDEFNSNLSYDPLESRLVFYDLQISGRMVGFECGTPRNFKLKQRDVIDELSGLLVRKSNGKITIRGSGRIE